MFLFSLSDVVNFATFVKKCVAHDQTYDVILMPVVRGNGCDALA